MNTYLRSAAILGLASLAFVGCTTPNTPTPEVETPPVVEEEQVVVTDFDEATYTVLTDESTVTWTGEKVGGTHYGTFPLTDGALQTTEGVITSGTLVLDLANLTVDDLEGEQAAALAGHLQAEGFFNTAQFPTATLTITGSTSEALNAEVTIKDTTAPVTIPVVFTEKNDMIMATGSMTLDRSEFDLSFEGPSDLAVKNDVMLEFEITLQ